MSAQRIGVCVVALVLAGCGTPAPSPTSAKHHPPAPLPPVSACHQDRAGLSAGPDRHAGCTPGVWIVDADTSYAHVCHKGYNPRPSLAATSALKRDGLKLYGLPASAGASTESDHLYPVWAGGATVIDNLWPEPNYAHPPDQYTHNPKDALEFAIYKLTCQRHKLTVAQARAVFESDWRVAYRQYVGPLAP